MKTRIGSLLMAFAAAVLLSACAGTSAPHPLVGAWEITIETPIGSMNANLQVNEDMSGELTSQELGAASLDGITVDGDAVSFSTTVDAQGQSLMLVFAGTVVGDVMSGSFNTDFGAIPVSGRRI
jgi:ABC-type glycerol-3-phosphate transport system substrate-binding protein